MVSEEKIWEIIQNKANISGTWRHYWSFVAPFSEERVFIAVHENWSSYTVSIFVFDKPKRQGHGNLQIFKVSSHSILSEAKEKAEEMKSKLKNLECDHRLPIVGFLNEKEFDLGGYGYDNVDDEVSEVFRRSLWSHSLLLSVWKTDDYLRPFDIIKINRGGYHHYAVYLGKGYICHFSGDKEGISGSGSLKAEKDTLGNFFQGKTEHSVAVIRPVVKFKSKDKIIEDIAKTIVSEYGKYKYDIFENNCEHFSKMIVLGINHSGQGNGLKSLTSPIATNLKKEIKECSQVLDGLISSSDSGVKNLVSEIKILTQTNQDSLDGWEARIEVNTKPLNNIWCKIQ